MVGLYLPWHKYTNMTIKMEPIRLDSKPKETWKVTIERTMAEMGKNWNG